MSTTGTPVIFRRYPDGDIIAFLPTIPADPQGNCLAYQHIGQHGAADPAHVIAHTRPATPDEYRDLMAELTGIGYVVRPVTRVTRRMGDEREAMLRRALPAGRTDSTTGGVTRCPGC